MQHPGRLIYPAADRNKGPITAALAPILVDAHRVLELASGSGQHCAHLAQNFPLVHFQPSEVEDQSLFKSINTYAENCKNVASPLPLNATNPEHWQAMRDKVEAEGPFDVVYFSNLLHISPWNVTECIAREVPTLLAKQGAVCIYGPFNRDGNFTSDSNREFDLNLRERNEEWGLRDLEVVAQEFKKSGLHLAEIKDMPANNFTLVFMRN
ncbi:hypothetical protein DFS34DRAFT_613022 [Phlyctochytrium arcticum]|nr:hypothetical protein DFS34DRAFT_613022 [Phlyctochytrium arcticum]